jgi:hypothetical protein
MMRNYVGFIYITNDSGGGGGGRGNPWDTVSRDLSALLVKLDRVAGASDNGLSELRQSHASRGRRMIGVITAGH